MIKWFEEVAPIRTKFRVLTIAVSAPAAAGLFATWASGASPLSLAAAAGAWLAAPAIVALAGRHICTPYVNTVVRMEALAAGDVASPIPYGTYTDCVGRMTKAMSVFRDNAVEIERNRAAQTEIVEALTAGLKKLSNRELGVRLHEWSSSDYDGLRNDFHEACSVLAGTIAAVSAAASNVSSGSSEIRAASDDLALRNEQQAARLEETAAAMSQVSSGMRETAQSAARVQSSIGDAHREATEGGDTVRRAIGAMTAIEQGAREITQIINVIDGIAFQTNLLALNAGVEAARAGDAGKGFAVVANEVRALAQRSADAARDIKALITGSTEQVEDGVRLVNETGAVLDKIVSSVGEINNAASEIARATENQSVNLGQVSTAIHEMDRMTQQNAAMVEQSTAAARSLAEEARSLADQVNAFDTGRGGGAQDRAVVSLPRPTAAAAPASRPSRPMPSRGNLAVKVDLAADAAVASDDDWSEF